LLQGVHLVTASALLDLVSAGWIERLAELCGGAGAAALFALNYNGWSACIPGDPDDEFVLEQFNRHQRSNDKGFGPAAGPDAANVAAQAFSNVGYQVRMERSDWKLTSEMRDLQASLLEGWAHAVREISPEHGDRVDTWLTRRLEYVCAGESRIQVGHTDVAAWQPAHRS
jgi:hypothetical protein